MDKIRKSFKTKRFQSSLLKGIARQTYLILWLVLPALLVSCQQAIPSNQQRSFNQAALLGLRGLPLIEERGGNCSLDQLEAREEGFRFAGSVGGLALPFADTPAPLGEPILIASELDGLLALDGASLLGKWQHDVALLVLDDFKGHLFPQLPGQGVYQLGEGLFSLEAEGLPDDPTLRASVLEEKLQSLLEQGQLSHGALVLNHVFSIMSQLAEVVAVDDRSVLFRKDNHVMLVSGVDTQDFQTDLISTVLRNHIQSLATSSSFQGIPIDLKRFSVNMSFALVPCSILNDYEASRVQQKVTNFNAYIALVTCLNAREQFALDARECSEASVLFQQLQDDLWALATQPLPNDPLEAAVTQLADVGGSTQADAVAFAASAGNYGDQLTFPLAPAAWDVVTSVSASLVDKETLADFSNPAEVKIAGAWFHLGDATGFQNVSKELLDRSAIVYAGTSFAAPAVAVFTALDLAQQLPHCMMSDSSQAQFFKPLLAYYPQAKLFANLELQEVIHRYCQ